ncbi:uncharacterized protein LOC114261641 [Camellia sinensis]|uniref:uncharacterized protein LOC114261641 n=1 Tax=Camellia sinensis TaxID=4442 RepID=UPI0010367163|nr:uncharacterized protein LOC114261641 [Camellia sinensis]
MLQETCRSGRISAGFRFLQYYIHLGRLYWIGSTRSLFLLIISPLLDIILNAEFSMLVIGLCSILTTDPGYVTNESSHHNQLVESPVSVFEAHSEELVPSTRDIPYEFVAEKESSLIADVWCNYSTGSLSADVARSLLAKCLNAIGA